MLPRSWVLSVQGRWMGCAARALAGHHFARHGQYRAAGADRKQLLMQDACHRPWGISKCHSVAGCSQSATSPASPPAHPRRLCNVLCYLVFCCMHAAAGLVMEMKRERQNGRTAKADLPSRRAMHANPLDRLSAGDDKSAPNRFFDSALRLPHQRQSHFLPIFF